MAKKICFGVNEIARKVKVADFGVDEIARKVKKGYIGVNGIAQQFYSSITEITTPQLFFGLDYFSSDPSSVVSTITGSATANLADGTRPTLELSTNTSKGFRLGSYSSTYSGYDNTAAVVDNTYKESVSNINTILKRTSIDSDTLVKFRAGTSTSYNSIRTFIFDFKTSRKLTLNLYFGTTNSCAFYGSNDGTTWTAIQTGLETSTKLSISSTTPYRYYKLVSPSYYDFEIYYMYFSNIQDWQ